MKKILVGPNAAWVAARLSREVDWKGISRGKEYWIDPVKAVFTDDNGQPRTQDAWMFENIKIAYTDPTQNPDPLVNPKKACGAVKAPMHTIPPLPMIQANNVMAGGSHKYGLYNYRESMIDAMTYIGAIKRHFDLWQDGEDIDPESLQSHLAHLIADCAILLDCQIRGQLIDNRKKTGLLAKELIKSQETFQHFIAHNKSLEERNEARNIS